MNLPDKCPFCGAGIVVMENGEKCVSKNWVAFQCITSIHAGQDIRRTQSRGCETAERIRLTARVAELEARYERLRQLADELRVCAGYLGWTSSDDSDCITRAERACEAWDKEAKG